MCEHSFIHLPELEALCLFKVNKDSSMFNLFAVLDFKL